MLLSLIIVYISSSWNGRARSHLKSDCFSTHFDLSCRSKGRVFLVSCTCSGTRSKYEHRLAFGRGIKNLSIFFSFSALQTHLLASCQGWFLIELFALEATFSSMHSKKHASSLCNLILKPFFSLYNFYVVCWVESDAAVLASFAPSLLVLVLKLLEKVTCKHEWMVLGVFGHAAECLKIVLHTFASLLK